jgi:hypothetical protein
MGIKNFPVHQLILLCYPYDKSKAIRYTKEIDTLIGLGSEIILVEKEDIVKNTVDRVNEVLLKNSLE